jgi:ferrous iron transport protein B
MPSLKAVLKQTWGRTKSIIYIVFPIYIVGSALVQALYVYNVLTPVSNALSPLTVTWLGLPVASGILLVLGVVRKELIILGAVAIFGSTNLGLFFTPVQLVVMALVAMLYIPCISTMAILGKEFGWKATAVITTANIGAALLIGGLAFRLLSLFV